MDRHGGIKASFTEQKQPPTEGETMKPLVLYSTKSGNTEKVAKAIAQELSCQCLRITKNSDFSNVDLNDFDTVFIGTGIYKGKPQTDLLNYLQGATIHGRKQFALFMTSFGWGKGIADKNTIDTIQTILSARGQSMLGNSYCCFESGLGFVKRGHPNNNELNEAGKWAKKLI
jgi:flavodoxin